MKVEIFNNVKYYIGRSAKENWQLLDDSKKINEHFIWFHLNSFASPYVIMYTTIDELKYECSSDVSSVSINQYIEYGARLCHQYSKYKFLKDIKVIYIPVKNLCKGDKLGEVNVKGRAKIISL